LESGAFDSHRRHNPQPPPPSEEEIGKSFVKVIGNIEESSDRKEYFEQETQRFERISISAQQLAPTGDLIINAL